MAAIFANIFSCNPPALDFRLSVLGASKVPHKCVNNNTVTLPLSVLHIVFDFALLSVPLVVLYRVQMSLSKKIRMCILFSVGAISCIGSIMRQSIQSVKHPDMTCKYLPSFVSVEIPLTGFNLLDEYPDLHKWAIVDMFFAITAASLPVLNCLVPKSWGSRPTRDLTGITPMDNNSGSLHGTAFRPESK